MPQAGPSKTSVVTFSDASQDVTWVVPAGITSVNVLVVGGGGGGGGANGSLNTHASGGGGAGGYRYMTQTVTPGAVCSINVGFGGRGGVGAASGTNGEYSSFSGAGCGSVVAVGGGGGGYSGDGLTGGSGGGGGNSVNTDYIGGLGTSGQGTYGGASVSGSNQGAGGGGGSANSGGNASSGFGGNGGSGTTNAITGTSVVYACGGGAAGYRSGVSGAAGCLGAGAGGNASGPDGVSAVAGYYGMGGGGATAPEGSIRRGGNGSQGVVVVRYPAISEQGSAAVSESAYRSITFDKSYPSTVSPSYSNGYLTVSASASGDHMAYFPLSKTITSGKWYWEISADSIGDGHNLEYGLMPEANLADGKSSGGGTFRTGYGFDDDGAVFTNGSRSGGFPGVSSGTVVGVAYDADNGKIWFRTSSSWAKSGNPATGANPSAFGLSAPAWVPVVAMELNSGGTGRSVRATINPGSKAFAYDVPAGFKALSDSEEVSSTQTQSQLASGASVAETLSELVRLLSEALQQLLRLQSR